MAHTPWTLQRLQAAYKAYERGAARHDPPMAGSEEREAEDVTGLRMLEEFLAKRKQEKE